MPIEYTPDTVADTLGKALYCRLDIYLDHGEWGKERLTAEDLTEVIKDILEKDSE